MIENLASLDTALSELDEVAPSAPLLALGQTVLWDEPMKGGVALLLRERGSNRRFVAGVHDTDYFAKLRIGAEVKRKGRFAAFPHNDTSTRGLWSAAGEFSALFGSETVISKQDFLNAGLRIATVLRSRPHALDEASEAWRWRGIVSLEDEAPLAMDVPLEQVFPVLQETLEWALDETAGSLAESEQKRAREQIASLHRILCDRVESSETLTEFYRQILPDVYSFSAGEPVPLETTTTRELLRFNLETWTLPRFDLVRRFVDPQSRNAVKEAYNDAIRGSEIYDLSRFGSGAIPFDLVIPGKGRGTLRLGNRGAVIMTREPQFLSFRRPPSGLEDLALAVQEKFGPDCVLIGKAVTLIGMLSREFVFVFHEGASSYVKYSRKFHDELDKKGFSDRYHPILRVRYQAWNTLSSCCSWIRLPDPLRAPFGTEELCGPSFAGRWKEVGSEQSLRLARLAILKGPLDLIRYLEDEVGGAWKSLAAEYVDLHTRLEGLSEAILELKRERHACHRKLRELKQQRVAAEVAKGEHFRQFIFERTPSDTELEERKRLKLEVDHVIRQIEDTKHATSELMRRQSERVSDPLVQGWHQRRRAIELEAELKRMRLIRQAIVTSRGLERAGRRPSAWWFPIVCPGGNWFRETIRNAEAYLEPL